MTENFGNRLITKIRDKKSFLCLGLDPHIPLIPDIFNVNNQKLSLFERKSAIHPWPPYMALHGDFLTYIIFKNIVKMSFKRIRIK